MTPFEDRYTTISKLNDSKALTIEKLNETLRNLQADNPRLWEEMALLHTLKAFPIEALPALNCMLQGPMFQFMKDEKWLREAERSRKEEQLKEKRKI